MPRTERGFTLIEFVIILMILAIFATVALPSFSDLAARNRIAADINRLNGSLQYARSTALRTAAAIVVCPGTATQGCRDDGHWERGWITFTDPGGDLLCKRKAANNCADGGKIIRVAGAAEGGTLRATGQPAQAVRFTRMGHADGYLGTFTRCSADGRTGAGFTIIMTGRLRRLAPEDVSCP